LTGIDTTPVRAGPAAAYFDAVEAAYNEALTGGFPEIQRHFSIAGRTIRLSFAGETLEPILAPAFEHIQCDRVEFPDFTLACWDDASTGVVTPEPPGPPGRIGLDFVDESVRIAWEPARRSLSLFEPTRRLGLMRFADADSASVWEHAAPARRTLHWWAAGHDMQLVHAAAVGSHEGGVLLVGRGGSGKSTTALACFGSSLKYLADDYCAVSFDDTPRVFSLYSTGKADATSVSLLPSLADAFAASPRRIDGKRVVFCARHFPSSLLHSCSLRAIVVPKLGAAKPGLVRISAAQALRMVAPSTMMQLPGDRAGTLARVATIVKALPCYEMALGPDPYAAVPLLESLSRGEAA
jgi:hypothetical protein